MLNEYHSTHCCCVYVWLFDANWFSARFIWGEYICLMLFALFTHRSITRQINFIVLNVFSMFIVTPHFIWTEKSSSSLFEIDLKMILVSTWLLFFFFLSQPYFCFWTDGLVKKRTKWNENKKCLIHEKKIRFKFIFERVKKEIVTESHVVSSISGTFKTRNKQTNNEEFSENDSRLLLNLKWNIFKFFSISSSISYSKINRKTNCKLEKIEYFYQKFVIRIRLNILFSIPKLVFTIFFSGLSQQRNQIVDMFVQLETIIHCVGCYQFALMLEIECHWKGLLSEIM